MNSILTEKEYQRFIMDHLEQEQGYIVRKDTCFDRFHAMDRDMLFKFLKDTQPNIMATLGKMYGDQLEDTVVNYLNSEMTKARGSLLNVLKHGIEINGMHLDLMYTRPATDFNQDLMKKYEQNIFSVMEEVWASDKERVDLVIFLNGLPIISFELKCNVAGQSYQDAMYQYRTERDPKTRLFLFKAGCIVNFAMDLEEVYMTTKLEGSPTFFLPFNMGRGEGAECGAGNPLFEDRYSVSYMWESILAKDSLLELISKFIFIETKEKTNETTGKKTVKESIIFPRYHQRDAVHKLLEDVTVNGTTQNYLIQHSAGSGKTNTIAWLAHRLASLHDVSNRIIFDNIIIMTDRIVVDRQLQAAIMGIEHKSGLIRVMDDRCSSKDLAEAIKGNTKIIVTTIQKFPYIMNDISGLNAKKFAVIVDEAHSSTSGQEMMAVMKTLGRDAVNSEEDTDVEDMIAEEIRCSGKQPNVSLFAFTATPKPTTLQMFGRVNRAGQREAFHIYSMSQAIEEGFILDVLQNYITYKTFYQINKEISDDPKCKTNEAKRQIARFVELHETNISQRIEVIIEHFRQVVMKELNGTAKAMVITASRASAVKYRQAFEDYINRKGYTDVKALVAFSGTVSIDGNDYTETSMNKISEDKLPGVFDGDEYQVLLVADKYQTGFDQPKLCALYVMKKLKGVAAVQSLSRLNRICLPHDKHTFILDFVNDYDDIKSAFSKYYKSTLLSNSVTPTAIYDLEAKIDAYMFLNPMDIENANVLLYKPSLTAKEKKQVTFFLQKAKADIEKLPKHDRDEAVMLMRHFCRLYVFIIQATSFEDTELHKKYRFISYLLAFINNSHPGMGFDLDGKIKAENFVQKKTGEHAEEPIIADPIVTLPMAEPFGLTEDKVKKLSEIISEINSRTGRAFDNDVAVKAMLQVKDIMIKSDELKRSANNNTEKDFKLSYLKNIDNALIEGLEQNKDFFTLLLENDELKHRVMGIFSEEIYKVLRETKG